MNIAGTFLALAVAVTIAAIGVRDARTFIIDPKLSLILVVLTLAWQTLGGGYAVLGIDWLESLAGAGLGALLAITPIVFARLFRRRPPILPGDILLLATLGLLLGPLGLAWAIVVGCFFVVGHRVCLQRKRNRPITLGYCPLGPGMTAGALIVFMVAHAGGALAQEQPAQSSGPQTSGPGLSATVLVPVPSDPGPAGAMNQEVEIGQAVPLAFPVLAGRIGAIAGYEIEIQERPSRVAGGARRLPDPAPMALAFKGKLSALLDLVARRGGYAWEWRDRTIVLYRYHDVDHAGASQAATKSSGGSPRGGEWVAEPGVHKTVKGVLTAWAEQAGWSLVWQPEHDYRLGATATFDGEFLDAVNELLADGATRRSLMKFAHPANRHLVIKQAGATGS